MRVPVSLFFVLSIAIAAWASGATNLAIAGLVGAALGVIVIMSTFDQPPALAPRTPDHFVDPGAGLIDIDLIGAIGEPVLLLSDGRVRAANQAARALLGNHIVGEDVRLAIRHPLAAERLAHGAADGSVEMVGIGGAERRYAVNVTTVSAGQRLVHMIDRTGRHAVEKARVDFVANASHELRTPLSALLGFIETLRDEATGEDAQLRGRFLSVMDKEAQRMQRLIDDLISLSRIEADKYALPETQVALPLLVRQVIAEIPNLGSDQHIDATIDDTVPSVAGDATQLSQVMHNLIGNAIKYGGGTPITVDLQRDTNAVRIRVIDGGDGIAAEHIPRLTERFYRVDAGRSRSLGGTGLGLAIVKHIIERHRGRLDIASQPGKGTTVSVSLPVAPAAVPTPSHPIAVIER